jgi:hypothetical protein
MILGSEIAKLLRRGGFILGQKEVVLHCGQYLVYWKKFAMMGKAVESILATGVASVWRWPIQLSSTLRDIGESRAVQLIHILARTDTRA